MICPDTEKVNDVELDLVLGLVLGIGIPLLLLLLLAALACFCCCNRTITGEWVSLEMQGLQFI